MKTKVFEAVPAAAEFPVRREELTIDLRGLDARLDHILERLTFEVPLLMGEGGLLTSEALDALSASGFNNREVEEMVHEVEVLLRRKMLVRLLSERMV